MTAALRLILPLVFLLVLVSACLKKGADEAVVQIDAFTGHSCHLVSQINSDGSRMEFQYNSAGQLIRIERWLAKYQFLTFEYNADGTLKARENQLYNDSFVRTREEFRYVDQRLTEVQRFSRFAANEPFKPDNRRAFDLDSLGRIIQVRHFFRVNGVERESAYVRYGYDARNLISRLDFQAPSDGGRVAYEWQFQYDSGLNPRFRSAALPDDPATYSLNNQTGFSAKDFIGNLDLCGNRLVQYRYNAQGYPVRWLPNCAAREVEATYACP